MMYESVCVTVGQGGLSRREQLVRYLQRAPSRRGLLSGPTRLTDVCYLTLVSGHNHIISFSHVSATDTLTLLIKVPATVTFYRGHRRTLLLPARDYLPDHHVHRNYFHIITFTQADAPYPGRGLNRTSNQRNTAHVTLYCTWCPCGLATGLRGQRTTCCYKCKKNLNSLKHCVISQITSSKTTKIIL